MHSMLKSRTHYWQSKNVQMQIQKLKYHSHKVGYQVTKSLV